MLIPKFYPWVYKCRCLVSCSELASCMIWLTMEVRSKLLIDVLPSFVLQYLRMQCSCSCEGRSSSIRLYNPLQFVSEICGCLQIGHLLPNDYRFLTLCRHVAAHVLVQLYFVICVAKENDKLADVQCLPR